MPANKNNGFIKIYRKLLNWEWYHNSNVVRVFLHLLLKANHENVSWQGTLIRRGQTVISYSNVAKDIGDLSIHQIRGALEKLKVTREVAIKTTNKFTVVTINNYDAYQSSDTQMGSKTAHRVANKWQTSGKQVATNKKDKNEKNEKKDTYGDAQEFLDFFNSTFGKSYKSMDWLDNYELWKQTYTQEEIKQAVTNWKEHGWFIEEGSERPEILFRTKNKNGQCDYIGELLNSKKKKGLI